MKNALMSYGSSDIGSVDGKVLLDKIVVTITASNGNIRKKTHKVNCER